MSASREKKNRQTLAAQEGYVDPKAQRQAEEAAKNRKSRAIYVTIAVVFVIVAVLLAVLQSGVLQRSATAVTVNGQKFTPAQVDYFYYSAYNTVRNNDYYAYMGLDTSTPLKDQTMSSLAKMILGEESEEDVTWDQFLKDAAKTNLSQAYALAEAAKAEGVTLNEEYTAMYDESMETFRSYAKANGYTEKSFLKAVYGNYMTPAVYAECLKTVMLAEQYRSDYVAGLNYTDAELEAQYLEEKEEFDRADYETIYFNGTAPSTTDADGNTVEATDEAKEEAKAAALAGAEEASARYAAGESLEAIAADSDIATYTYVTDGAHYETDLLEWVFDSARVEGDTAVIASGDNQYFVVFHKCEKPTYNVVDVMHILALPDTDDLDTASETYAADYQAAWDEAKARAESWYDQWKAGEATADSFSALALEVSDDTGVSSNGGLYESVSRDDSYTDAFLEWCLDPSRKEGDCEVIESALGYHVMYLKSVGLPYWEEMVTNDLKNHDYSEWMENITADLVVEEGDGMKYVG